jgi:hypothetical protein
VLEKDWFEVTKCFDHLVFRHEFQGRDVLVAKDVCVGNLFAACFCAKHLVAKIMLC